MAVRSTTIYQTLLPLDICCGLQSAPINERLSSSQTSTNTKSSFLYLAMFWAIHNCAFVSQLPCLRATTANLLTAFANSCSTRLCNTYISFIVCQFLCITYLRTMHRVSYNEREAHIIDLPFIVVAIYFFRV